MKIGELFVEIGTKGGATTAKELTTIRASLQDVKSMSLATKAAIAGVLYELGNLSRQSMNMGQSLAQFGNLTGLSPEALQKWQYALQQSGVEANETAQAIKHLQDVTSDIIQNGNIPNGFKVIAESVQLDPTRLRDTFYVLDKFREYARAHKDNPDMTRALLAPTIGNDKVIQALMTGTFDPNKTPRSQKYSGNQIATLNAEKIALTNLGTEWEHFLGKLTAKHGMPIIKELQILTQQLEHLVSVLDQFSEKWKIFEGFSEAAGNLKNAALGDFSNIGKSKPLYVEPNKYKQFWDTLFQSLQHPSLSLPSGRALSGHTLNQTVNIHGAEKPHESGHSVKKEVGRAFRTMQTGQHN